MKTKNKFKFLNKIHKNQIKKKNKIKKKINY